MLKRITSLAACLILIAGLAGCANLSLTLGLITVNKTGKKCEHQEKKWRDHGKHKEVSDAPAGEPELVVEVEETEVN